MVIALADKVEVMTSVISNHPLVPVVVVTAVVSVGGSNS
jgi:hypothetical protein